MRNWMDIVCGLAATGASEPAGAEAGSLLTLLEADRGASLALDEGVAIHDLVHMIGFCVSVAEAYEAAPRYDPAERKHWDALNSSNNDVLLRRMQGAGIRIEYTPQDPYDHDGGDTRMMIRRMLWDMTVNNRLQIYSGHSDDHPVFSARDNVIFRTVHDYFTHGKLRKVFSRQADLFRGKSMPSAEQLTELLPKIDLSRAGNQGHAFTLRGELNSYSSHAKLAPPEALPALFTEVVGQVCYQVIVGDFPQQKASVLQGFDFRKVGQTRAGSPADKRMREVIEQMEGGERTLSLRLRARPKVEVGFLKKAVAQAMAGNAA